MSALSTLVGYITLAVLVRQTSSSIFDISKSSLISQDSQSGGHVRNAMIHGMVCSCNLETRGLPIRDDYHYTPGVGSHKLHAKPLEWNEARKVCHEEGGHLAIINSVAEARVLTDLFNRSLWRNPSWKEMFIGIHDIYTEGEWTTVLGDSLARAGYTEWSDGWGGQPDNGLGSGQNCGAMLRDGTLDDVPCETKLPYICEQPGLIPM